MRAAAPAAWSRPTTAARDSASGTRITKDSMPADPCGAAGAPREATPLGRLTAAPSYAIYGDDRVVFYYDWLPRGTYSFYFRVRASFLGSFAQPPARAELMYDSRVHGRSGGAEIRIVGEAP